jgi:hemerythrin-like domain-containing protein
MEPIGPLMHEHRLIDRMVALMAQDLERIRDNVAVDPAFAFVDPVFIDKAVDFLRTYADRCHHGKEEDILFVELAKKPLSPEHRRLMAELNAEHAFARETTARLVKAKENYLRQEEGAVDQILICLKQLTDFYPQHIAKEDREFFFPCLDYFTPAERAELLHRMQEFDRQLIHEKYAGLVESIEHHRCCHL